MPRTRAEDRQERVYVSFRVAPPLYDRFRRLAARERRKLGELLDVALTDLLDDIEAAANVVEVVPAAAEERETERVNRRLWIDPDVAERLREVTERAAPSQEEIIRQALRRLLRDAPEGAS